MRSKLPFYLILVLLSVSVNSCSPSVRKAYKKIIKPCTKNDLLGKMLFFGPANNLGPGDVLIKQSGGGFGLSFRLTTLIAEEAARAEIISASNPGKCEGTAKLSKKLSGKVSAKDYVNEADAEVTLSTAEKITTEISEFSWVTLEQATFERKINSLEDDNGLLTSILKKDTYVITRALKVQGLHVTYSFAQAVDASAKAKLSELGTSLSGNWKDDRTFKLEVKDEFYIAGELRPYLEDGLSNSGSNFGLPIDISEDAKVNIDDATDE